MKPHDLSVLFSVFEHDRRVKYRSNMFSLRETSSSLLFKNRAASLVLLTVTLVLFLQATAITWTKKPPNPIFGILSKNVTLEWNFTLNSARVLDSFELKKRTVNDKWLKNVVKYDETGIMFYESFVKSVVMLRNGTTSFMLLNLTKEDEGLYCCDVNTKASGGGKTGKSYRECTQLTILVSPTIAAISLDQTVNETGNVTLSCQAKGIPPPTITWLKADDERKNLSSTSELSLKNINRDQDGLYLCIANNRAGKAIASIAVTVHYKPRATRLTSNLPENTVTLGQPVKFHCSADGVPSPMYELRFENIFLGDSREGVFVIQKVNSSHQGKYECTPKNILGHGKIATIILNVVGWYKKRKACSFSRSFHTEFSPLNHG
ncbi:opioid-binding protein/cell adhesion molecule homolog isoform X1 [Acropora millepora]|uniref:opioid-binding protein/cell adhesion molecule homolog isoform X1 n=1 Tax=Acropora millepora TaxID=45264 RepID=UPI001CF1A88D|nr:opioid-binding protein/cell adhesion molecule homolog isoform X1 [Acropora millepora]XP_044180635.1 opioid-binding protein/cell adhesion molecule homolog isoform X1 [Acropora millepora]